MSVIVANKHAHVPKPQVKVVAVHSWTQTKQIRFVNDNTYYVKDNVSINHLKKTLRNVVINDIVEDNCKFYFDVKDFLVSRLSVPKDI